MIDTDKLKPNPFDPFIVIREYVEWYPENAPAIQARGGHTTIAFTVELLAEVKRLRRVIEDIESMIPDNHEEVSPILSDILSECHRVLPMFDEVSE